MNGSGSTILEFRGPFGVPVVIQSSIIFLGLILIGFSGGVANLIYSAIFFAMLVLSIFLHEFGHAWGCIVQGVPVRRVVIFGGGGFCEYARAPTPYQSELIVAMGPIVNFAIWAVISLGHTWIGGGLVFDNYYLTIALLDLAWINLFLGILNMIPVVPLDGGRLLQLGLMRFFPAATATRITGGVGLAFSVLWFPAMFFSFVFYGLVLFFFPSIRLHYEMLRAGP